MPIYTVYGVVSADGTHDVAAVVSGQVKPIDSGAPPGAPLRWVSVVRAPDTDAAEARGIALQGDWQAGRFDPANVSVEIQAPGRGRLGRARKNKALPVV